MDRVRSDVTAGSGSLVIERIQVQGFRNLHRAELDAAPGLNLLLGENAAGKTSLLEAIFLLGRPKSFRSGSPRDWLERGEKRFSIFGEIRSGSRRRRLGIGWAENTMARRLDGNDARSAELARLFPVTVFEPGMHGWLEDSPDYRRALLDWYLFHVEPEFLGVWQRYRRILQQRNHALRERPQQASLWNEGFVEHSVALDLSRRRILETLEPVFRSTLLELSPAFQSVRLRYRPGGAESVDSMHERLVEIQEREFQQRTSQIGAHRFDWRFEDDDGALKRRASRGQQKLLLLAFVLSQAKCIKMSCGLSPVFLLDDFASELDRAHQIKTLETIRDMESQVFLTALGESTIPSEWYQQAAVFHVEHGRPTRQ